MREAVIAALKARFGAYEDLIGDVAEADLALTVDVPAHKSLADHLWCVVGSRESYVRALAAGKWAGFDCSMSAFRRGDFEAALARTAREAATAVEGVTDWTPARDDLLVSLHEHEVMHEGQIIRHMLALGRTLPTSWRWA
jgi:hypothetical protein